jgi:hypothetical protein
MRARNLKPGFFKNEELADLPFEARLLFAGLWCIADREGRLEDRPRRIKAEVFPYDAVDIEKLLEQLRTARSIVRYTVEGHDGGVIWIPTFKRHQNPHKNEKPSELPAYSDIAKLREDSGASTEVLAPRARLSSSLNPSSLNPSSLNPDIPVGVAETATDADEFADIDFGGPDPDTEQPPQNGKRPKKDVPEQPTPDNAGTMVGYLVDYAGEIGFTLTGSKKGHFAKAIGDIWKAGVDPPLLRRAIRQALETNKSPAHLVDVVNDLKGGGRGKARADSGRSQHGEWE